MEQKTRYRLTGTLFLLSAGYILIMLLMGEPVSESENIPELQVDIEKIPDIPSFDEVASESDVVEVIEELKSAVDEDGFSTENGTLFGQPVLVPLSSDSKVFSVQAASFKIVNNANNLRWPKKFLLSSQETHQKPVLIASVKCRGLTTI